MSRVCIRKMKFDDIECLPNIMKNDEKHLLAFTPTLRYLSKSKDFKNAYIAHVNQVGIGFVFGQVITGNTLIPMYLYVANEYRGKKIGKKLMRRLEEKSGCTESLIFYNKCLHDYYKNQQYFTGDNLEIAIKFLKTEETP